MPALNVTSRPKPAVAFKYTGYLQSLIEAQEFITANGFKVTSMSMNSVEDMKFNVSLVYHKALTPTPTTTPPTTLYTTGTLNLSEGYLIIHDNSGTILFAKQAGFEEDYDINQ